MYRTPINFHKRLLRGEIPLVYVVIHTPVGYRAYAEKELRDIFGINRLLADGSVIADGSATAGAGGQDVISKSARITGMGTFERTISPENSDILSAWSNKQKQHVSIPMDNSDLYFSKLLGEEPFIGSGLQIYVGFENTPQSEHLNIFQGTISEIELDDQGIINLEADER